MEDNQKQDHNPCQVEQADKQLQKWILYESVGWYRMKFTFLYANENLKTSIGVIPSKTLLLLRFLDYTRKFKRLQNLNFGTNAKINAETSKFWYVRSENSHPSEFSARYYFYKSCIKEQFIIPLNTNSITKLISFCCDQGWDGIQRRTG